VRWVKHRRHAPGGGTGAEPVPASRMDGLS
jgi:hypothetical protein